MKNDVKKHVFIVGSKGIPAQYGGFETFVENLTVRKVSKNIVYHVSCMNNDEKNFLYNNAECFNVKLPLKGAPGRILHVSRALSIVEAWKREHEDEQAIVYILGCRIGPMLIPHYRKLRKLGIKVLVNPDGLEWKRDKWNHAAKKFLKYCERCLVINSDMVICDSKNIEKYIQEAYPKKVGQTTYIAYGAEIKKSECSEKIIVDWLAKNDLKKNEYYLIVGRFVPENNYETMITEFMKSNTEKSLVIITNVEKNAFYTQLKEKTHFDQDKRIRFVGTVYEQELLKKIREEAYAYIHGHEVGGTNPSLLEALASTKVNLLLDVGFNREVGEDAALYWNKTNGSLAGLIEEADGLSFETMEQINAMSMERVKNAFSWDAICDSYERVFSWE